MSDTVNWSQLKKSADDATKPAPDGDHPVEIGKATLVTNSSGNPMYKIQAKIFDGPATGKTVFNNFNITVDSAFAMAIFFRHMAALGLDDNFFGNGPSHEEVCSALVGRRSMWTLSTREWQGQPRNQVEDIKPLSGPLASMPIGGGSSIGGAPVGVQGGSQPPVPSLPSGPPVPQMSTTPATAPPPVPFD